MSINIRIARATFVIGFFTLLVKLASIGKEMFVAKVFGTSSAIDAYLIAFLVANFFVNIVSGSFNAAFIPTFVQVRKDEDRIAAQRLLTSVLTFSALLLIILIIILSLTSHIYLPIIASGFSQQKLLLTRKLLYILLPILLMNGFITILASAINACEKFAFVAFAPICIPVTIIICLWLFGDKYGVFSLTGGMLIGVFFNFIILVYELRNLGFTMKFGWLINNQTKRVFRQYAPMVAGALLMSGTVLVDHAMAAMLKAGSVAVLSYGYKVIALFTGIITFSLSNAILPYFSKQVAEERNSEVKNTFNKYLIISLCMSVPIMSFIFIFSEPLVKIIFQRGAFSTSDTKLVSEVQTFYSFMLPSYLAGIVGVRLLSSLKKNHVLMIISGINLLSNIILNIILMKYYGVSGIALSTSLVYLISTILIFLFLINIFDTNIFSKKLLLIFFVWVLYFFINFLGIRLLNLPLRCVIWVLTSALNIYLVLKISKIKIGSSLKGILENK